MLPNLGLSELIIILVIVLILFGAKRLPDVAKGLGRSIKAFKDGMDESSSDKKDDKGNDKI